MKILRVTAALFTVSMGMSLGCTGSGCLQGTNLNSNNKPQIRCGRGTAERGGFCVPTRNARSR